jgi:CBS domain-containing protein
MDDMSMQIEDEYAGKAGEMQDEADAMLELPKGKFSASALNGLVKAFNQALSSAGMEGDYPTFTSDQTVFPVDFVRGLAMLSDAAAESGSGIEITLAGVVSDRDVALLASKVAALAKSEEFMRMMAEGDGETEVEVEVKTSPEDLMMERA